jgi:hypothetical protein
MSQPEKVEERMTEKTDAEVIPPETKVLTPEQMSQILLAMNKNINELTTRFNKLDEWAGGADKTIVATATTVNKMIEMARQPQSSPSGLTGAPLGQMPGGDRDINGIMQLLNLADRFGLTPHGAPTPKQILSEDFMPRIIEQILTNSLQQSQAVTSLLTNQAATVAGKKLGENLLRS